MKKSANLLFKCLTNPIPKQSLDFKGAPNWKISKKGKKKRRKIKKQKHFKPKKCPLKYKDYIVSKFWLARRLRLFKSYGSKCVICGSGKNINVHHAFYGHYGNERDEDLIVLCNFHHGLFHESVSIKKDMRQETYDFIKEQQDLLLFPTFGD